MKQVHPMASRVSRDLVRLSLLLCGIVSISIRFCPALAADDPSLVVNTPHNLSVSGSTDLRSDTETEICIFCHAPHGTTGQVPLWNHQLSAAIYKPYASPTLKATMGQPSGVSRLCLSCHDGTIALGLVASRTAPISMRNGTAPMPDGINRIGTDLNRHHPFSFTYDSALAAQQGQLRDPRTLIGKVKTDQFQQLQCTACHDPHSNLYGKFLVEQNHGSSLCLECHIMQGWQNSAHATSLARADGTAKGTAARNSSATVAEHGCGNCHVSHAAGSEVHMLAYAKPDDNCLSCHDGTVAGKNIASEVAKATAHSASTGNLLARDAARGPRQAAGREISCLGCHSAHAAGANSTATASRLASSLTQSKGMTAAGGIVETAAHEYEICFRCHADTAARNSTAAPRQCTEPNLRLIFSPANASYHPVVASAKRPDDKTLISPWTPASVMKCTDCHNNDQGPGANGSGPKGPHGSRFAHLLERNLRDEDFQPESPEAYALCYKCHNESAVLADRLHASHVRDQQTACTTCHDPHGVRTQSHLINFNTIYVRPLKGQIIYTSRGLDRSTCTLTCHGKVHEQSSYP